MSSIPVNAVTHSSTDSQGQVSLIQRSSHQHNPPCLAASMSATEQQKKRSWIGKYTPTTSGSRPGSSSGSTRDQASPLSQSHSLPELPEGIETAMTMPTSPPGSRPGTASSSPSTLTRGLSYDSLPTLSRPTTPKRSSTSTSLLTSASPKVAPEQLDQQASQLILNALERTNSAQLKPPELASKDKGSFSKMSFSSMMGGLSNLSLSRTSTNNSTTSVGQGEDKDRESRGRSLNIIKSPRSSSHAATPQEAPSRSQSRARSQSPFTFRRFRTRESSPTPQPIPLAQSDVDLSDHSPVIRPRNAFTDGDDSGDETVGETDAESEEEEWSEDEDMFDPLTEHNTERNAFVEPADMPGLEGEDIDPDPLGEGVNVVVPPEPYFPSTLNSYSAGGGSVRGKRNPRKRKSTKHHEPLPLETSRPIFQRDRCTITIKQGDPEGKLGDRRSKRYVIASDMSEESRYAVEWGIGTVVRDGDELLIVTIIENEGKVDPRIPNAADRAVKLRSQQERQGMAYILVRQATSLLQRTKLNVKVTCQAWHAKNSRHMLLDVVDYNEPIMLIVGSRGLGQLKGILLGSTSHYLIQKCSVPVMVARRRLKRPPRRSAHLAKHRAHVSLAEAGIDRVAAKVDQDVKVMRDEIQRDDDRRDGGAEDGIEEEDHGDEEEEIEDSPAGVKVAG